jgi:uncharacterized protein YndB with AHSA1/START domain
MSRVTASVVIDASPKEVWEVVADPRNLPHWNRRITKVHGVPRDGIEDGTEYTTVVSFMGVGAHVDAEVVELQPPELSRIRLSGPVLDAVVTTRLTELDDGKTELEQVVDYDLRGGALGRLAAKALDVSGGPGMVLRRGIQAQKRQIEEG